jgi:hypothetical protein
MTRSIAWDKVTHADVLRAIEEYDRLGPERFFSAHGFAPTTTYDLVWDKRRYPPKAILGTAYELATGQRLASGDFEGGKTGAVKVLGKLGFTIQPRRPARKADPSVSMVSPRPLQSRLGPGASSSSAMARSFQRLNPVSGPTVRSGDNSRALAQPTLAVPGVASA